MVILCIRTKIYGFPGGAIVKNLSATAGEPKFLMKEKYIDVKSKGLSKTL